MIGNGAVTYSCGLQALVLFDRRRQLRAHDFKDLKAGRPVPGKTAYRQRVRNILRSAKAQTHAAACARGFRKVCAEVVKKHGAASRG